jgi:hypothetical protein
MRASGTCLVRDYREGVKEKIDPETGEITRRAWALIECADGLAFFCEQGTLNGEAEQLNGVTHLKCHVELDVKQKGNAKFVDLRSIEVLGTVDL